MDRKGKVTPCKWAGDRKGADTNSANESGARNVEAETEYQKRSEEYGRECKIEDSRRDKTEQCTERV